MALTYQVNEAKVSLKRKKSTLRERVGAVSKRLLKIMHRSLSFAFAFCTTWVIFYAYTCEATLADTIALGAIFATFGSAVVSIFTLFCNEQYNQFGDNSKILQEQLIGITNWERWPFVKRLRKHKISRGMYEFQVLENPSIVFFGSLWNITIPLPASKPDFYELPTYRCLIRLIRNRSIYRHVLESHQSPDAVKEILLWDCLTGIYKNIASYRFGRFFIWLGGCFVFSSIFFSLFYNFLKNIL